MTAMMRKARTHGRGHLRQFTFSYIGQARGAKGSSINQFYTGKNTKPYLKCIFLTRKSQSTYDKRERTDKTKYTLYLMALIDDP